MAVFSDQEFRAQIDELKCALEKKNEELRNVKEKLAISKEGEANLMSENLLLRGKVSAYEFMISGGNKR